MVRRSSWGGRSPAGTGWFVAGYVGIAGFLALEAVARKRGSASSLDASRDDQGTTGMIGITYGLAAELPLVLRRVPAPRLPPVAGPAARALVLAAEQPCGPAVVLVLGAPAAGRFMRLLAGYGAACRRPASARPAGRD